MQLNPLLATLCKGGVLYGDIQYLPFLDDISVTSMINSRYSVFQLPNGDSKMHFLIENTTVTVIIQKFDTLLR